MAKGNRKATVTKMTAKLNKGFKEYESLYDMLIGQAEEMSMPLLVESLTLSKSILQTYKNAWQFKIKEDQKVKA